MNPYRKGPLYLCALLAALAVASPAWAIKPYTLVEDGYPEATGQLELENTFEFNWHARNETGFKEFTGEHELEYGFSPQLTLRAKGSYVYTDSADVEGFHFDAAGVEAQYYFTNPNTDPIGVSVIGAVEAHEREGAAAEAFLVLQKDFDRWTVTYNLGAATDVDNFFRGHDRATEGTLINALGAVYNVTPRIRIGAEIAAESVYAEWSRYENTTVFAGPVINLIPNDRLWITAGIDYQITGHADEPQYRAAIIIGYYF